MKDLRGGFVGRHPPGLVIGIFVSFSLLYFVNKLLISLLKGGFDIVLL